MFSFGAQYLILISFVLVALDYNLGHAFPPCPYFIAPHQTDLGCASLVRAGTSLAHF